MKKYVFTVNVWADNGLDADFFARNLIDALDDMRNDGLMTPASEEEVEVGRVEIEYTKRVPPFDQDPRRSGLSRY